MISRQENRLFGLLLTVVFLIVACFLIFYLGEILFLLFLGVVLAYLLNPLIVRLEARGYQRERVVIGFYIVGIAAVILAARILIPLAIGAAVTRHDRLAEFAGLLDTFPKDIETRWLSKLPVGSEQAVAAMEAGRQWIQKSLSGVPAALIQFSPKLLNLIVIPLVTYFPLAEGPSWMNALIRVCPRRHVEKVVSLVYQIDEVLGSYLRGLMMDCLCFGVVTFIALHLLGLRYALELAILAGVVNVMPYLGPFSVAILASGLGYMQFHDVSVIYKIVLTIMALKFVDDWMLQPYIMRNAVELHPLVGLFALAAGSQLFGFVGLIFAVPVAAAIQAGVRVFYDWYVAETGTHPTPFSRHVARIPSI
ncbi:MAG: AI-2E family transporter [Acidobacteriota bacterium]|nr:AI-2E family transporter [Acidobacteriota bacterium]